MHNQEWVHKTCLLDAIGDNAANKVRLSCHQHVNQVIELVTEIRTNRLEISLFGGRFGFNNHFLLSTSVTRRGQVLLFLRLTRMIAINFIHQLASPCLFEQVHNGVVYRIPIFIQPTGDIVGNSTSVVNTSKMCIL